jgi:hypothetical protein
MIESAQIEMTRLSGLGNSTVCRAKLSVVSAVFEPKVSLPDTQPPAAIAVLLRRRQGFACSLSRSVPNLFNQSPMIAKVYNELMPVTRQAGCG